MLTKGWDNPQVRNLIACVVYTAIIIFPALIRRFFNFVFHGKQIVINIGASRYEKFNVLVDSVNYMSGIIFLAQFMFLLYVVKQRMRLVRMFCCSEE